MARFFTVVSAATDTFYSWLGKTNDMLNAFAETVTVKANTAGDMTTGNGFVTGILGANTLTASVIRGGNVQSNAAISILSNTSLGNTSSEVFVLQNGIGHTKVSSYLTSNTDAQIVDSFSTTDFRAGKYLLSITSSTNYQSTEIMMMHDGTNVSTTEYATLTSGSTLGTFTANINSGTVRLYVTPTNAVTTFKYNRSLIAV
jgi:hypothetical protein